MESLGEPIPSFTPGKIPGMDIIKSGKKKQKEEKVLRKDKALENIDFS